VGETAGVLAAKLRFFLFMLSTPIETLSLFTSYSHPVSFLPACGFRLEIESESHKKKAELYFAWPFKKILTKNRIWHWRLFHSERIMGAKENSLGEIGEEEFGQTLQFAPVLFKPPRKRSPSR
jgi:hypothetical protein